MLQPHREVTACFRSAVIGVQITAENAAFDGSGLNCSIAVCLAQPIGGFPALPHPGPSAILTFSAVQQPPAISFLPLDEAVASRAVFAIVSGSDGRADGRTAGRKRCWSQLNKSAISPPIGGEAKHRATIIRPKAASFSALFKRR